MSKGQRRRPGAIVFVAEDDPDLRTAIGEMLVESGYHPVLFETGQMLLASLERSTPAAIITDMVMPGLSGAQVIVALREDIRWRAIPVVVMTGNNDTALPLRIDAPVVYKPEIEGVIPVIATMLAREHVTA